MVTSYEWYKSKTYLTTGSIGNQDEKGIDKGKSGDYNNIIENIYCLS